MRPRPGRDPARSVSGMAAIALQPGACSAGLMHGPAPPLCLPPALSPRLASQSGTTSLHASAQKGHDGIVRALLEHKAQITQQVPG